MSLVDELGLLIPGLFPGGLCILIPGAIPGGRTCCGGIGWLLLG